MKDTTPAEYDAWYHTPRGRWIADREFRLMTDMLKLKTKDRLLDVGCGTGYFSRRFAQYGAGVTGVDPDEAALAYARRQSEDVNYVEANAQLLPFDDNIFEYCVAVTSLCFITNPATALSEMLRVSRKGAVLGLLNRKSILYYQKHGKGTYQGARWDTCLSVNQWLDELNMSSEYRICRSAVIIPSDSYFSKQVENITPASFLFGGFLAVKIDKAPVN